jgi:hypothetical protein
MMPNVKEEPGEPLELAVVDSRQQTLLPRLTKMEKHERWTKTDIRN